MLTLTSVTANGNEDDGLDAQGTGTASPSVTITGGTYNSNGDDGIDFSGPYADSTLKIDGATANLNDDKGFDFDGFDDYSFDFDNLVADANGDDGVDIDVNRTNISIDNSFARNNGDDGFEVESSGGEALARITLTNVVASGGEDGVDATNLDRTDLSIDHGSFFNNVESGLNIEGDEPGNRILVTNSCIERNGFPRDSDDTPRGGIFLRDLVSSDVSLTRFSGQFV